MKINLIYQRGDSELRARVSGDVLTINGEDFDFSPLLDGHALPTGSVGSEFIAGEVRRSTGRIELFLVVPYSAGVDPPQNEEIVIDSGDLP